jgi:D-lactate dehydrogenase (cytochrome)
VKLQSEAFGEIAADSGSSEFIWTQNTEERAKLWKARHDVYWSAKALMPGGSVISTDVCVPISQLADCITETERDIDAHGLVGPIVGHVGDGNFHVSMVIDASDPAQIASAEDFIARLNARALAMDGTCTGEHGIGQGKQEFLVSELGNAVDVMRLIKRSLDPKNIFNPGKIFTLDKP